MSENVMGRGLSGGASIPRSPPLGSAHQGSSARSFGSSTNGGASNGQRMTKTQRRTLAPTANETAQHQLNSKLSASDRCSTTNTTTTNTTTNNTTTTTTTTYHSFSHSFSHSFLTPSSLHRRAAASVARRLENKLKYRMGADELEHQNFFNPAFNANHDV
jgi:hypothetical protein